VKGNWWILAVAAVLALVILRVRGPSVAPAPAGFDPAMTLAAAGELAAGGRKPVLVFATADWCGPCRALKKGALADARVIGLVRDRTIPVYMDMTSASTVPAGAESLNITGIPALILLRDGKEVARLVGAVPAEQVAAWLEQET